MYSSALLISLSAGLDRAAMDQALRKHEKDVIGPILETTRKGQALEKEDRAAEQSLQKLKDAIIRLQDEIVNQPARAKAIEKIAADRMASATKQNISEGPLNIVANSEEKQPASTTEERGTKIKEAIVKNARGVSGRGLHSKT